MKSIYLTVDTECHDINHVNQYIYGKTDKGEYGIKKILELAKELNITVNFFLDVVESRKYGDEYIEDIVSLIKSYRQPVFLHLHPNYVSDDERSYLWEYSSDEQLKIILEGISDYERFVDSKDNIVFRAGRYGVDESVYEALNKSGKIQLDLSYCCNDMKMCRLKSAPQNNVAFKMDKITVLPNTRYIGLSVFGKKKCFNLDTADTTKDEFFSFVKKTELKTIIWTMHSWNFIKKWFFAPKFIKGNDYEISKFIECVRFAKQNGYVFGNLQEYKYAEETDELVNLCEGVSGKIKCITNNFIRFRKIGRLTKKYFLIYHFAYLLCFVILVIAAILFFEC